MQTPRPHRSLRCLCSSLLILLTSIAAGCGGGSSDTQGDLINNAKELELGRVLDEHHTLINSVVSDEDPLGVWANEFITPVSESSSSYRNPEEFEGYKVRVIDKPESAEIYSLPAGHIYLTTGLILKSESCAEISALVSREMAHIAQRHVLDEFIEQRGLLGTADLFLHDKLLPESDPAVIEIYDAIEFDRTQVAEADDYSLQITFYAGYNPYGIVDVFERLIEQADDASLDPLNSSMLKTTERLTLITTTIQSRYSIRVQREVTQSYACLGTTQTLEEIQTHVQTGALQIKEGSGTGSTETP